MMGFSVQGDMEEEDVECRIVKPGEGSAELIMNTVDLCLDGELLIFLGFFGNWS